MEGQDFSKDIQQLVKENGDEVAIHEPPCILWKADHSNCSGCQYELGCAKVVRLMLIMLTPTMYNPKDYSDYSKMQERLQDLNGRVLKAKTVGELHLIPTQ